MSKIQTEEKVRGFLASAEITNTQRADLFDAFFVMNSLHFAKYLYGVEVPLNLKSQLISEKVTTPPKASDNRDQLQLAVDALITLSRLDPKMLGLLEDNSTLAQAIATGKAVDVQRAIDAMVALAETDPGVAEIATHNPNAARELIATVRGGLKL